MATKATPKITATTNYRLFHRSHENRALDMAKHKKLRQSMTSYGWLSSFPMSCARNGDKHLIVKDGQHRLAIAEELGLPVLYVVDDVDYDVALVNCTPKPWTTRDYAMKYAANGNQQYQDGIDFADRHGLPIGIAFGLLAGTVHFSNIKAQFADGNFVVTDREYADDVALLYTRITALSNDVRSVRFLEACMSVCRVKDLDHQRMIAGATRCREKLVSYSTKDAYLSLLEELYNFGHKSLVPLKIAAEQSMRERNAVRK